MVALKTKGNTTMKANKPITKKCRCLYCKLKRWHRRHPDAPAHMERVLLWMLWVEHFLKIVVNNMNLGA